LVGICDDDVQVGSVSTLNVEDVAAKIRPELKVAKFSDIFQGKRIVKSIVASRQCTGVTSSFDFASSLDISVYRSNSGTGNIRLIRI
jgi:hypothetical protein